MVYRSAQCSGIAPVSFECRLGAFPQRSLLRHAVKFFGADADFAVLPQFFQDGGHNSARLAHYFNFTF
jgi:hypothetical protein